MGRLGSLASWASDAAPSGSASTWGRPVAVHVFGNLATLLFVGMVFVVYQLFASYILVIFHALLLSEVLWPLKHAVYRFFRGTLGHGTVGSIFVLLLLTLGVSISIGFFALGCVDLLAALRAGRESLQEMNMTSLVAIGISRDTIDQGFDLVNAKLTDLQAQYNQSAWWPIVDDMVEWGTQNEEASTNRVAPWEILANSTALWERGRMLVAVVQGQEQFVGYVKDYLLYVPRLAGAVIAILLSLTSSVSTSIFFVSLTSTLLSARRNVLHELIGSLLGDTAEEHFQKVLSGIFFYPVALAVLRLLYTLAACFVLSVPFKFLLTFLTFLLTAIPVLSMYPIATALPWIVAWAINGHLTYACLLFVSQQFVLGILETRLLNRSLSSVVPSWATGLSVVLGFERFGIQAFVVGPLALSLVIMAYRALAALLLEEEDDSSDEEASRSLRRQLARAVPMS